MLNQVGDGVWVRQSGWVWSTAIAVRGQDGLILVDPGIDGSDLNQLADDLYQLGFPVIAAFSSHPHWDQLLWHDRLDCEPSHPRPGEAEPSGWTRALESAVWTPLRP